MVSQNESLSKWFSEVVQPQLNILRHFGKDFQTRPDFDIKSFFKLLLADLELLGLDNDFVESQAEKIVDGVRTFRDEKLDLGHADLKELAKVALITNLFDRALFHSYWAYYMPLKKKHKDLKDESLVNAYRVTIYCQTLADYIENAEINIRPVEEAA